MKNWGSLTAAGLLVAAAVHCGRTGLLGLDEAPIDTTDDAGAPPGTPDAAAPDARDDGSTTPAGFVKVGDAEVPNDQQIAAGEAHACLRTTKGEVFCWGSNELGQLGDGTLENRAFAKRVEGLPYIVRVTGGTHHTCALDQSGALWCWGGNTQGEMGQGTMGRDALLKPTKLALPPVIGISGGGYHTCAYDSNGAAYCWGRNIWGECGPLNDANVLTPKKVPQLDAVIDIGAGTDHTCAVMADRTVRCWGRNNDGQIGNATSGGAEITPVAAVGVQNALTVFAGDDHTCIVLLNGSMQCWGDNENGELGSGVAQFANKALPVVGISDGYQGGGGREHTCVAAQSGGVYCWGANTSCQVGNTGVLCGQGGGIATVASRVGVDDARWVATGETFSCAAHKAKGAMCWGSNDRGQLGQGVMDDLGPKPGIPSEVQGL